jgi:uncharacterized membrane protein YqjE
VDQTRIEPDQQDQRSYGALLSGLLKDIQDLLRGEVRLAKAEIREDIASLTRGIAMLAVAAILSLVGLIALTIAAGILLNEWIDEGWQAFGLVALALLLLAAVLGLVGKNRLSATSMAPDQTIESLKEDKEWVSQQVRSLRN